MMGSGCTQLHFGIGIEFRGVCMVSNGIDFILVSPVSPRDAAVPFSQKQ